MGLVFCGSVGGCWRDSRWFLGFWCCVLFEMRWAWRFSFLGWWLLTVSRLGGHTPLSVGGGFGLPRPLTLRFAP